jgi:hypothetical protein
MVWMPDRCPVCKSDVMPRRRCKNEERDGTPCLGLDATDAALMRARMLFVDGKISLDELEERITVALTDPPPRRFGLVIEFR